MINLDFPSFSTESKVIQESCSQIVGQFVGHHTDGYLWIFISSFVKWDDQNAWPVMSQLALKF